MANSLNTNPIVLDTFSSDFTAMTGGQRVIAIVFRSPTASDRFILEATDGMWVFDLTVAAGIANGSESNIHLEFGYPGFPVSQPLTCDVSDGQYNSAARAYIYLA